VKNHGEYELIGKTRDDAAGEAFDKVGKLLDFDYPGGPKISNHAEKGNADAIPFPRPMLDSGDSDFSFAGLKTAALYWLRDNAKKSGSSFLLSASIIKDFCASFEQAIVDVLIKKTMSAAKKHNPKTILLAGGVSANKKLRATLETIITGELPDCRFLLPAQTHTMDNAAMIAAAGYFRAKNNQFTPRDELDVDPNWKVYE